jgi:hypothetical protein
VQPFNPTDDADSHVFLQDNIFYSFALGAHSAWEKKGGKKSATSAASHDVRSVSRLMGLPLQSELRAVARQQRVIATIEEAKEKKRKNNTISFNSFHFILLMISVSEEEITAAVKKVVEEVEKEKEKELEEVDFTGENEKKLNRTFFSSSHVFFCCFSSSSLQTTCVSSLLSL